MDGNERTLATTRNIFQFRYLSATVEKLLHNEHSTAFITCGGYWSCCCLAVPCYHWKATVAHAANVTIQFLLCSSFSLDTILNVELCYLLKDSSKWRCPVVSIHLMQFFLNKKRRERETQNKSDKGNLVTVINSIKSHTQRHSHCLDVYLRQIRYETIVQRISFGFHSIWIVSGQNLVLLRYGTSHGTQIDRLCIRGTVCAHWYGQTLVLKLTKRANSM